MKKISTTLLAVAALGLTAGAQAAPPTFARAASGITEATIIAATGKADADLSGLTVDAAGNIYVVDTDGADVIVKITPAGVATVLATDAALQAAVDTANGTLATGTFNPRQLAIAADGDLIVLGFVTSANLDALISVNTTTGAPTVIYTPVNAGDSILDGSGALTVIGNIAYVATDATNGPSARVLSIDTNDAAAPAATVNTILSQVQLEAHFAALTGPPVGNEVAINALANNGGLLYGTASAANTANCPDVVVTIDPATSVITTVVNKADILNALTTAAGSAQTDSGYGAIAVDNEGRIWLLNGFGAGASDDSIIRRTSAGVFDVVLEATIASQLSAPGIDMAATPAVFLANDSLFFANDKVYYAESSESPAGAETIAVADDNSPVADWNRYE